MSVLTAEERRLRAITESQWQDTVIQYAQVRKWLVFHARPSLTTKGKWLTAVSADGAGFPDLVLCRNGRIVFAELKRETGRLSDAQETWLKALEPREGSYGGHEVYVWRPSDMAEVERILA